MASDSLMDELLLYPKAGLVSQNDNGSHNDMDYNLFILSIESLKEYFDNLIIQAVKAHSFSDLKNLGVIAEQKMLQVTNDINTHRGAIFIMGILLPSIVYALENKLPITHIPEIITHQYSEDIKQHKTNPLSHGSLIRQKFNLITITELAAKGFPIVFQALDYLKRQLDRYDTKHAYLTTFYYIMCLLDDTNIVYRGGLNGLSFAKNHAKEIIKLTNYQDIYDYALYLHNRFIEKNLSAGGCADVFSATLLLHKVTQKWG